MREGIPFNNIYRQLCNELLIKGWWGNSTIELRDKVFTVEDISTVFSTVRKPSISYALAELIWYTVGARDVAYISQFGSMWKRLTDDGCTNNSAYGYVLQKQEGFNQIDKVVELLKADHESRRAVMNINKANPYVIETHDEPCTIALQFLIREGKLHASGIMRSNDIYFGLPYDIIYFTTLQKIIADRLGVQYGAYTHHAISLHAYLRDLDKIKRFAEDNEEPPKWWIDHVALQAYAKELYEITNKENIIDECEKRGVLFYEG